jgi:hypothetical protein
MVRSAHTVFMCFVNSDLCHLQHKLIGFITEMKSVYSAVRTGPLNKAVCAPFLKGYTHINLIHKCNEYNLMFVLFILDVLEITNTTHRLAPLLYSICWLLHVSAVVCHRQEARRSVLVT